MEASTTRSSHISNVKCSLTLLTPWKKSLKWYSIRSIDSHGIKTSSSFKRHRWKVWVRWLSWDINKIKAYLIWIIENFLTNNCVFRMHQKEHTTFSTLLFQMAKKHMTSKVNRQRQIVVIQSLEYKRLSEGLRMARFYTVCSCNAI